MNNWNKLSKYLREELGLNVYKEFPRPAVQFMKKHFNNKSLFGVEIGTWEGQHAKSIFKELNCWLDCVDPYIHYNEYDNYPNLNIYDAEKIARNRLEKFAKIKFVKKYSSIAVKDYNNNELDFVYIDGNHIYDYVKEDIKIWYPKLKKNGILCGHDAHNKEVLKAVQEFAKKKNKLFYVGREDWWLIK